MKYTKQNGVRNVWDKAGFWRLFGGVFESQKMRTQICETVNSWLLKMRVGYSGGWWVRVEDWMDLLEFGGGLGGVPGEEPKRRQRLRARWCR